MDQPTALKISQLEAVLVSDAELAAKFERYLNNGCTREERKMLLAQIEFMDHRIEVINREIRKLGRGEGSNLSITEIERVVPVISFERQKQLSGSAKVQFFGLEEVNPVALAA